MSEIDFSRLRSLAARELISALQRDGFVLERRSGSHQQFYHEDGRRVTVSSHQTGDTFPQGTLRRIVQDQARWTIEDLQRLRLL